MDANGRFETLACRVQIAPDDLKRRRSRLHAQPLANASGSFELNVAKPVLVYNLLQSLRVLADSVSVFAKRCVGGIDVDRERLASNVERSLLAVTALNPILGYDRVAQITETAIRNGVTPRAAAIALGFIDSGEYDRLVDPAVLAKGDPAKQQ